MIFFKCRNGSNGHFTSGEMYSKSAPCRRDILSRGFWLQLGLFPSIDSHAWQVLRSCVGRRALAAKRVHEAGFLDRVANGGFQYKVRNPDRQDGDSEAGQRGNDDLALVLGGQCDFHSAIVRGAV